MATILSMGLLNLSTPALADSTTSDLSEWIHIYSLEEGSRMSAAQSYANQRDCLENGVDFLRSQRATQTGIRRRAAAFGRFGNLSAYLICAPSGESVMVFVSGPRSQYQRVQRLRIRLTNEFRRYY
ncbi:MULTISPECIES: hypothetical protein [Aerosakkonema]|uniref:hypothetical protein n=1 Tax=Aerosakkonema TaxID=1246629 RepID=UPI0035B9CC84